jgi:hypothetical protein
VGNALLEIRERRLYREQFSRFEDYCQDRWNWSRAHAYRLIDAAQVVHNVSPIGDTPKNEAQARELVKLPPEEQREVAATVDFRTATAAEIRARVKQRRAAAAPRPASTAQAKRAEPSYKAAKIRCFNTLGEALRGVHQLWDTYPDQREDIWAMLKSWIDEGLEFTQWGSGSVRQPNGKVLPVDWQAPAAAHEIK